MTEYWLYRWPNARANYSDKPIVFTAESNEAALEQAVKYSPCFKWELYDGSAWNDKTKQIKPK